MAATKDWSGASTESTIAEHARFWGHLVSICMAGKNKKYVINNLFLQNSGISKPMVCQTYGLRAGRL